MIEKSEKRNKRVLITRYGGPEVLQIVEEDLPEPGSDEVRVRVLAAGVSFADILMREGIHPKSWLMRTPFTPGWDIVGIVDRIGRGVSSFQIGDLVAALPIVGGYTRYICLPESELIFVPPELDPGEAVSLVMNYATAYQMLHYSAHIRPGERVLIHSAAGGIGTALLQLGELMRLEMYGTASLQKHDIVTRYGGKPIDYKNLDFVTEIMRVTGDGVDVVFDGIGGSNLKRSYQVLRPGGNLIAYGLFATLQERQKHSRLVVSNIKDWAAAFAMNLTLNGRRVKLYSIQTMKRQHPNWYRSDMAALFDLLAKRKIEPLISARLPLEEASQALDLVATGSIMGKIVLVNS